MLILEQIPILARTNPGDHQPPFMAKALLNHHGWENKIATSQTWMCTFLLQSGTYLSRYCCAVGGSSGGLSGGSILLIM